MQADRHAVDASITCLSLVSRASRSRVVRSLQRQARVDAARVKVAEMHRRASHVAFQAVHENLLAQLGALLWQLLRRTASNHARQSQMPTTNSGTLCARSSWRHWRQPRAHLARSWHACWTCAPGTSRTTTPLRILARPRCPRCRRSGAQRVRWRERVQGCTQRRPVSLQHYCGVAWAPLA